MATPLIIGTTLLSLAMRLSADEPLKMVMGENVRFIEKMSVRCELVHREKVFDVETVHFDCDEERQCTTDIDCEEGRHVGVMSFSSNGKIVVEAELVNPHAKP